MLATNKHSTVAKEIGQPNDLPPYGEVFPINETIDLPPPSEFGTRPKDFRVEL